MSFSTPRMRGQVTTKPGIVTSNSSVDQSFFSNSGLVDYHGGFGVSKAMDAPPMGPVNAHYEPVTEMASEQHPAMNSEVKPVSTQALSAEEAARNLARQITKTTSSVAMDSDTQALHTEFQQLSRNGKQPSFESWVKADVSRRTTLKAGGEIALKKQYDNLTAQLAPSQWTADTSAPMKHRMNAVEEHVSQISFAMDDHTKHLRQLRAGMQNHTDVLRHTVTGMHNHTSTLKELKLQEGKPINSKSMMKSFRKKTNKSMIKANEMASIVENR